MKYHYDRRRHSMTLWLYVDRLDSRLDDIQNTYSLWLML